jgi:hypothetical protein
MGLFDEKTEGQKSRDTVPLSCNDSTKMVFEFHSSVILMGYLHVLTCICWKLT